MAFLKAPEAPFSFSHQLLSTHSAHFLKVHSPGAGQVGVLLLLPYGVRAASLMGEGVAGAPGQTQRNPAAFHRVESQREG